MRQDHSDERATTSRRRVLAAQNVSRMCLVCGSENAFGLHGRFYVLEPGAEAGGRPDAETASHGADASPAGRDAPGPAELLGVFTPRDEHQSYPGRLHGGIAAAALDETIGRAIIVAHPEIAGGEVWGVTVELTVRFRQPLPLDRELRVLGRITRDGSRIFEGSGEILLDDGSVAVEARGKYLKMRLEDIAPEGMDEREWFADERRHPDWIDV